MPTDDKLPSAAREIHTFLARLELGIIGGCADMPESFPLEMNDVVFIDPHRETARRIALKSKGINAFMAALQKTHPAVFEALLDNGGINDVVNAMPTNETVFRDVCELYRSFRMRWDRMRAIKVANSCLSRGEVESAHAALDAVVHQTPIKYPAAAALPEDWNIKEIPTRKFVFNGVFPLDNVSLVFSEGGMGKSALALVLSASVATCKTLLDGWQPQERGCVLLVSAEDDMTEITRRLQRVARAYNLDERDTEHIREKLRIITPDPAKSFFVSNKGAVSAGQALAELRRIALIWKPRLIILDPLAALLNGLPENDNAIAQVCISILREALPEECALVVLAHVSKAERSDANSPRGAGAWTDAARQAWGLRKLTSSEVRELRAESTCDFVVLELRKSNYTAPRPPLYLEKHDGVPFAFDVKDFRRRETESREQTLRHGILEAIQKISVTRQEVRNAANTPEGRQRGYEFRKLAAELAGVDKISAKELTNILDKMHSIGEVITIKKGNRSVLSISQTGKVAK